MSLDPEDRGPYSPTILKNILCLFLHDFCQSECNNTLDWLNVSFSQSDDVLHSNAAK